SPFCRRESHGVGGPGPRRQRIVRTRGVGMRVIDFFDRGAALDPQRVCLKDGQLTRTYREVQRRTYLIGNALIRDGLRPEDKAAVLSPNAAAPFECVLGILRAAGA